MPLGQGHVCSLFGVKAWWAARAPFLARVCFFFGNGVIKEDVRRIGFLGCTASAALYCLSCRPMTSSGCQRGSPIISSQLQCEIFLLVAQLVQSPRQLPLQMAAIGMAPAAVCLIASERSRILSLPMLKQSSCAFSFLLPLIRSMLVGWNSSSIRIAKSTVACSAHLAH